jgi:hypothetical protein
LRANKRNLAATKTLGSGPASVVASAVALCKSCGIVKLRGSQGLPLHSPDVVVAKQGATGWGCLSAGRGGNACEQTKWDAPIRRLLG